MTCEAVELGHGVYGFICARGQRRPKCSVTGCSRPSTHQCDQPLQGRAAGRRCGRNLCDRHAARHSVGKPVVVLDLCPAHHELARTEAPTEQLELLEDQHA